jgi:hypothetical protein
MNAQTERPAEDETAAKEDDAGAPPQMLEDEPDPMFLPALWPLW